MPSPCISPSRRSQIALDWLNFLMADVRDGVGPYLAVFLKGQEHWLSGAIGAAMAVNNVATALALIPAGLLVDGLRCKRLLIGGAGLFVAFSAILIALLPHPAIVFTAEAALGAAAAFLPPALVGISLGLVGPRALPGRISRNEGFNHAGNLAGALVIGVVTRFAGLRWIFYLACGYAIASAVVVALIPAREIDYDVARGAAGPQYPALPLSSLLWRRDFVVFLISVTLFHLGNAAMLPLAGQVLAATHPGSDAAAMSACIIVAQAVMVVVALVVGRMVARGWGRKTIFLIGLAVLPLRGVLFSLVSSPLGVVAVQALDGIGAGIFGVIAIVIAADLMRGTGRVNVAQGLVALATGLGGGASNLLAGEIAQHFGYPAGFLALAGAATLALGFFALFMRETGPPGNVMAQREMGRESGGAGRIVAIAPVQPAPHDDRTAP